MNESEPVDIENIREEFGDSHYEIIQKFRGYGKALCDEVESLRERVKELEATVSRLNHEKRIDNTRPDAT